MRSRKNIVDFSAASGDVRIGGAFDAADWGFSWPVSRGWDGRKMVYFCSVTDDDGLVMHCFVTHAFAEDFDHFFDPDVLENTGEETLVVCCRDGNVISEGFASSSDTTGPSVMLEDESAGPVFATILDATDAPKNMDLDARIGASREERQAFNSKVDGAKLGGAPDSMGTSVFPHDDDESWELVMQLYEEPMRLNVGPCPLLFLFRRVDGDEAMLTLLGE